VRSEGWEDDAMQDPRYGREEVEAHLHTPLRTLRITEPRRHRWSTMSGS